MKTKVFFFMLTLLVAAGSVSAQDYHYPLPASDNTIIRAVDAHLSVVYSEPGSGLPYFLFDIDFIPTSVKFELSNGLQVRDMRVLGRKLYFCGTAGGTHGMVGWFDVDSMLNQIGFIYIALSPSFTYFSVKDFIRMDMFWNGTGPEFALIGKTTFEYSSAYSYPTVCIAEAIPTIGGIIFNVFYNKDALIRYTDITCTDHHIVAVGPDSNGINTYMRVFPQTSNFVFAPPSNTSTWFLPFRYGTPLGRALATRCDGGCLDIIQHCESANPFTMMHHIEIDATGYPTTSCTTHYSTPGSSLSYFVNNWHLFDIDSRNDSTFFVERAEHPSSGITGMNRWLSIFTHTPGMPLLAKTWSNGYLPCSVGLISGSSIKNAGPSPYSTLGISLSFSTMAENSCEREGFTFPNFAPLFPARIYVSEGYETKNVSLTALRPFYFETRKDSMCE
jgi:hypothetical protein